jgi:energy-coupling factor transport system ATP-binding protein
VATALITGARILVLDEPTFGQDRERAADLLALLSELNTAGTTVIVVTHDLQLVADHARRVAVLADGRLLAVDTPHRVFADFDLMRRAGLLLPPLAEAMTGLTRHPGWRDIVRLDDLPRPADGRAGAHPPITDMR